MDILLIDLALADLLRQSYEKREIGGIGLDR